MLQAVRTISEDDRWHVIEGLAVPFDSPYVGGRDSYNTRFTAETDFGLATRSDLGIPIPIWYHHGLDPDFGFDTIGATTAIRTEADGIWVQAQLDKRHRYYETRVKPLLEASSVGVVAGKVASVRGGVGLSAGSAEHSQVIAARTGLVEAYPIHEISLTPTESNPYAVVAMRGDDGAERLVVAYREGEVAPPPDLEARAVAFRAWCESAYHAARGASILGEVLGLISDESDEAEQVAVLQRVADGLTEWIGLERAEIAAPEPQDVLDALAEIANLASQTASDLAVVPAAIASYIEPAIRAGRRNSSADQDRINSIGQHATAITEHVQALTPDSDSASDGDDDAAARSADAAAQPAMLIAVRSHAPDPYESLKSLAEQAGRERATELLGR